MKWLWKREWRNDKKKLLVQIAVGVFWPLIFLIIYKIRPSWLLPGISYMLALPKEVLALLGLTAGWKTDHILYYMLWPVLIVNVWMFWRQGVRMREAVRRDERYGCVYLICNQMYSRRQFVLAKYLWILISTLAVCAVWNVLFLLLVLAGTSDQTQRSEAVRLVLTQLITGSCVQLLFLSIIFMYTVYRRKQNDYLSSGVNLLIFGTLAVGNLYKIRDLVSLLIEKVQWNGSWIGVFHQASAWLDSLYWLSPLSWINPYILLQKGTPVAAAAGCVLLAGLCAFAGIRRYDKRELLDIMR